MNTHEDSQNDLDAILDQQGAEVRDAKKPTKKGYKRKPSRFDPDIVDSYYKWRDSNKTLHWKFVDVEDGPMIPAKPDSDEKIPLAEAVVLELRRAARRVPNKDNVHLKLSVRTATGVPESGKTRISFAAVPDDVEL